MEIFSLLEDLLTLIRKMHETGICDPEFDLGRSLNLEFSEKSDIIHEIAEFDRHLPVDLKVDFAPHPSKVDMGLGTTAWKTTKGNW